GRAGGGGREGWGWGGRGGAGAGGGGDAAPPGGGGGGVVFLLGPPPAVGDEDPCVETSMRGLGGDGDVFGGHPAAQVQAVIAEGLHRRVGREFHMDVLDRAAGRAIDLEHLLLTGGERGRDQRLGGGPPADGHAVWRAPPVCGG